MQCHPFRVCLKHLFCAAVPCTFQPPYADITVDVLTVSTKIVFIFFLPFSKAFLCLVLQLLFSI